VVDEQEGTEPEGAEPEGTEPNGQEPHAFGVPARALVDALRGAGMIDADVIAVVGRAIARSTGLLAAASSSSPFVFQTQIAETAPDCTLAFQRQFVHPDFIDGVTIVQGGATPEEIGFNQRFHTIETDLDHVAGDLHTASSCIAELRREVFGMAQELQAKITEIDTRLDGKTKDKEKDTKEKEKDTKEKEKDTKEKDTKEGKDKEGKDGKDAKEKDTKEKDKDKDNEKERGKDGQKEFVDLIPAPPAVSESQTPSGQPTGESAADEGEERTFIRLEDRPEVGRAALAEPADAPVAGVPDEAGRTGTGG
jgi:hypothetical protein